MHPPNTDYFERFLAEHMNRPLLDGYDGLSAAFCICFRDSGECWNLRLEKGQIVAALRAPEAQGPVRFEVDVPIFWDIVRGRTSPQAAFFARRTDIRGDLFLGMRLAKILGLFFERYPFTEPAVHGRRQ